MHLWYSGEGFAMYVEVLEDANMQVERKGADRTISGKAKLNIALKAAKYWFPCSLEFVLVNGTISDWNIWKRDFIFQFC